MTTWKSSHDGEDGLQRLGEASFRERGGGERRPQRDGGTLTAGKQGNLHAGASGTGWPPLPERDALELLNTVYHTI
ncbi:hypothetical protein RRF57_009570 [Xylaria bambusicola]|uniref:Uncharacterized protein n=1 Tax=Xylaria bambusicola TaxID=326684 RepID=A0AAN7UVT1_9PEZI